MLPTIARDVDHLTSKPPITPRPRRLAGLTTRQAWTLDHIAHCPVCGAWEVVTDDELHRRGAPTYTPPEWCRHGETTTP